MANSQLLDILLLGATDWNDWKKKNPGVKSDLRGALLVGANLQGVDLSGADLAGAQLPGAYLDRAQFSGVNLEGAKLFRAHIGAANMTNANLEKADLGGSHLAGADLTGAHLTGAHLRGANLYGANLNGTDFHQAEVGRTIFGNLDLSVAKGLDSVIHAEPSTVGLDTYYKSNGKIPLAFLQGAGVPEEFIAYLQRFSKAKG
jgi:uncharacterized protein YjbI with pentapeptide repeats